MLKLGRSRPWPQAMKMLTGQREVSSTAIKTYFKPLQNWLVRYRYENKYPLGWKDPQPAPEEENETDDGSNYRKTSEIGSVSEMKVIGNVNNPSVNDLQLEKFVGNEADPQSFSINTMNFASVGSVNEPAVELPTTQQIPATQAKTPEGKKPVFVPIRISPLNLGKK